MDHRVVEVGHLYTIDQADDDTRPSDLVTGLETAEGAIGELGQNRAPLALLDRHAGEEPTRRGRQPGEDICRLAIFVSADVNDEMPAFRNDIP